MSSQILKSIMNLLKYDDADIEQSRLSQEVKIRSRQGHGDDSHCRRRSERTGYGVGRYYGSLQEPECVLLSSTFAVLKLKVICNYTLYAV